MTFRCDASIIVMSTNAEHGRVLREQLRSFGISDPEFPATFAESRRQLQTQKPEVMILDLTEWSDQGLHLLSQGGKISPRTTLIALAPHDDRELTVAAMQRGAHSTLATPLHPKEVSLILSRILKKKTRASKIGLELRRSDGFYGIVGNCQTMRNLFEIVERVGSDGESTVLLYGESGVGKELVAQALHQSSPRGGQNFVPINCAAIPDSLMESELFGYEKGAFTGATQAKKGRLHHAHGGTLFLDEIGEMQPALQAKLLRVLQEREFEPVGGLQPVKVDTRIIAATNINLEEAVQNKTFRTDLYYRLSVIPIRIPPLRERQEDIPLLLDKFSLLYNRGRGGKPKKFTAEVLETLKQYPWPGNVRELKNLMQRLCVLHQGSTIRLKDLPQEFIGDINLEETEENCESKKSTAMDDNFIQLPAPEEETDFNSIVSEFEDRLILQALIATNGNKKQAARRLNLKRTTLLEKIKKKDLDRVFMSLRGQGA